jgi:threonine dehydratase
MARAVAYAARENGISCTALVPSRAPAFKKEAIRRLGAAIEEVSFEDLWKIIMTPSSLERSEYFIHPIVTPYLVQGYQAIAAEILADLNDCDAIIVPFGVGGLSLGIAQYLQLLAPHIDLYVCEPETAAPMQAALLARKSVAVSRQLSFVDAIGTPEVLECVLSALSDLLSGSIVVSLAEISAAMSLLFQDHKQVAEPAGAAALAAGIRLAREKPGVYRNIACIVTGGNISWEQFALIVSPTANAGS